MKNVSQPAFQARHDLLKAAQGDALLALLQPVQGGSGKANFFGKLGKGQVATLLTQKHRQLLFH